MQFDVLQYTSTQTNLPPLPLSGESNKTVSLSLKSFSCLSFSLKYYFVFHRNQLSSWPVPLGNVSIILRRQLWLKSLDAVTSFTAASLCLSGGCGILQRISSIPWHSEWNWNTRLKSAYQYEERKIKWKVLLAEGKFNLQCLKATTV